MIYQYKWKDGSHHKVSAQVAGEECEKLESDGRLTPSNLVDASRPDDAPLHDEFEWDDTIAAESYRKVQASSIIRHVVVVTHPKQDTESEVRKYVPVPYRDKDDGKKKSRYVCTFKALTEPETREMVLRRAMNELEAFRRKYSSLKEMASVIAAIEQLGESGIADSPRLPAKEG